MVPTIGAKILSGVKDNAVALMGAISPESDGGTVGGGSAATRASVQSVAARYGRGAGANWNAIGAGDAGGEEPRRCCPRSRAWPAS